jgi:hypothetical protein
LRRGAGTSTQRGSDRRLEGWHSCWRAQDPGGLLRPLPSKRQQWPRSAATAERHMAGAVPARAGPGCSFAAVPKVAATRVPQGSPGDLKRSRRARRSGSRGGIAMPPGAGGQPAPGPPKRRPRTRRTLRTAPRRRGRNGACLKRRSGEWRIGNSDSSPFPIRHRPFAELDQVRRRNVRPCRSRHKPNLAAWPARQGTHACPVDGASHNGNRPQFPQVAGWLGLSAAAKRTSSGHAHMPLSRPEALSTRRKQG